MLRWQNDERYRTSQTAVGCPHKGCGPRRMANTGSRVPIPLVFSLTSFRHANHLPAASKQYFVNIKTSRAVTFFRFPLFSIETNMVMTPVQITERTMSKVRKKQSKAQHKQNMLTAQTNTPCVTALAPLERNQHHRRFFVSQHILNDKNVILMRLIREKLR